MGFQPPLQSLRFWLDEVIAADGLRTHCPAYDSDILSAVLEGAGSLAAGAFADLNMRGDVEPARLENGVVRTTPGFAAAYKQLAGDGWVGLNATEAYGGQGLPEAIGAAAFELFTAANLSLSLCPMLTQGAIRALDVHGAQALKDRYLAKLIAGEWTGTMNLTEPQAGSDLALVRSKAEAAEDGLWRITGDKIFITWGDHDVADNIVHLVLARLPGAPEGVKGISLFVVPKRLVGADGVLGEHNRITTTKVEHKLGIHGSPTCALSFEGSLGELVGEPHQGVACMFTMMNAARLHVGLQGVGLAERAYQAAVAYTLERRQGRSVFTGEAPAPIADHPETRRSLLLMKAKIEASRAICLLAAACADVAHATEGDTARDASLREDLLIPMAKGWSSEVAVEVASMALQLHGGMGFMEETGAAQYYRDARILPIYEGTTTIQANDLIGRKLRPDALSAVAKLVADMRATVASMSTENDLSTSGAILDEAVMAFESAADWFAQKRSDADAQAGAVGFLKLSSEVVGGWMLARAALADGRRRMLFSFYADQVLGQVPAAARAVMAGAGVLIAFDPRTALDAA